VDSLSLALMILTAVGSSGELPYWAVTNQYGLMPEGNGMLANVKFQSLSDSDRVWKFDSGVSLAANYDASVKKVTPMVDELFVSGGWKCLRLDLGMRRRATEFNALGDLGSLSVTGGSLIWTNNCRTMPGYLLTLKPLAIPYTKEHLWIEGAFGDYKTMDSRYVSNALVHNTRLGIILKFNRFSFGLSLDHYAMWGGRHPVHGDMPATFDNYWRMVFGMSAGSSGTSSDVKNVIGNQLGAEKFKFAWQGDGWRVVAQHDIMYDDKSGMLFHNFPDGVNTVWFGFDDKRKWVSDVLFEYVNSMNQSGPKHEIKDEKGQTIILGGNDNYFNNGYYLSGWTYYGRIIGLPLFLPAEKVNGEARGVMSNRIQSYHIGLGGQLFKLMPYKLMLTWTNHFGTYDHPIENSPFGQFSFGYTSEAPLPVGNMNMVFKYGIYGDFGQCFKTTFGASIGFCIYFL